MPPPFGWICLGWSVSIHGRQVFSMLRRFDRSYWASAAHASLCCCCLYCNISADVAAAVAATTVSRAAADTEAVVAAAASIETSR